ncbi:MAG TPA: hypothetical protein VGO47_02035, partial [Chlamydiales bacterium]|nr:hypothetical protein [Chlamydiales bacterium]
IPDTGSVVRALDCYGLQSGNSIYMYIARPILATLHGYYCTENDVANIAYNAVSMPLGNVAIAIPPVQSVINRTSNLVGKVTHYLGQKITPASVPPYILPIVATSYTRFRLHCFLKSMIPYAIANLSGATILTPPKTKPSKLEVVLWFCHTLALLVAFGAARDPQIQQTAAPKVAAKAAQVPANKTVGNTKKEATTAPQIKGAAKIETKPIATNTAEGINEAEGSKTTRIADATKRLHEARAQRTAAHKPPSLRTRLFSKCFS